MDILKIKKLTEFAKLPTKGTPFSAGFDMYSAYSYILMPNKWISCKTDIAVEFPSGCYGRIAPKSGLALNSGISVSAGVIDPDFR